MPTVCSPQVASSPPPPTHTHSLCVPLLPSTPHTHVHIDGSEQAAALLQALKGAAAAALVLLPFLIFGWYGRVLFCSGESLLPCALPFGPFGHSALQCARLHTTAHHCKPLHTTAYHCTPLLPHRPVGPQDRTRAPQPGHGALAALLPVHMATYRPPTGVLACLPTTPCSR